MIRKIGPLTEVLPGQWIVMEPRLRDAICAEPREVIRRSGKRIYYFDRHREKEEYCAIHTVVALCDTKKEADRCFAVSQKQLDELNNVRRRRAEQFKALFA